MIVTDRVQTLKACNINSDILLYSNVELALFSTNIYLSHGCSVCALLLLDFVSHASLDFTLLALLCTRKPK